MAKTLQELVATSKQKAGAVASYFSGIYHRNFGKEVEPEAEEPRDSEQDRSLTGLDRESRRKLDRAVDALTGKPASSSRGNAKREKRKVVTSKTYKPQLDRF